MVTVAVDTPMNSYELSRERPAHVPIASDILQPRAFGGLSTPPSVLSSFNGDKFSGGFGTTQIFTPDYWTLRERSNQLFTENMYARGIIRRLVTNEINTGLSPEATPDEAIIGLDEDSLTDWSENVENRFGLWGKNPDVCDWKRQSTFGALQRTVRMEALIAGDILVVLRRSQRTRLPVVQLISGSLVQTPLGGSQSLRNGNEIKHGVEIDANGRQVAYHVNQGDGTSKRLPAFGEKSGRRLSWLVYGTDKRMNAVRGEPLLSMILQSLKEIDRYRDAAQRQAVINSMFAAQVTKTDDKPGTLPLQGGAVRRDSATTSNGDGTTQQLNIASYLPGIVIDEMQTGEEIKMFGTQGVDINFGAFEEAIIQAVAWSIEIPPEILRLSFSNNYSASQAAINEFKIAINRTWGDFGETFCTPVYVDWLISEVLLQKIPAPGLLQAWRDLSQYDVFGAWISTEWYGSIKPSTDMLKQVKASELLVAGGLSTRAREARVTTGTKFSKNIQRIKRENELIVAALRPMAEFRKEFDVTEDGPDAPAVSATDADELQAVIEELIDDLGGGASG